MRELVRLSEALAAGSLPSDVGAAMAEIVVLAEAMDQIDAAIAARLRVADAGKGHGSLPAGDTPVNGTLVPP